MGSCLIGVDPTDVVSLLAGDLGIGLGVLSPVLELIGLADGASGEAEGCGLWDGDIWTLRIKDVGDVTETVVVCPDVDGGCCGIPGKRWPPASTEVGDGMGNPGYLGGGGIPLGGCCMPGLKAKCGGLILIALMKCSIWFGVRPSNLGICGADGGVSVCSPSDIDEAAVELEADIFWASAIISCDIAILAIWGDMKGLNPGGNLPNGGIMPGGIPGGISGVAPRCFDILWPLTLTFCCMNGGPVIPGIGPIPCGW